MRALVLTLVLAAGAARAEPTPLRFALDRGVTCPSAAQLSHALDHRLGWGVASEGPPVEGARSLRLSLQATDLLRIVLTASPGSPPSQRTLAIHPSECRELADTVALLTEAWLRELTWSEVAPLEPLPPPPLVAPVVVAAPPPAAPPPPAKKQEPAVPLTLRLAGSALLFFNAGSSGTQFGGFGAALDLEAGLGPRFGVGLEGAWDAPLFAVVGPIENSGSITVTRASGSVYGRYSFRPGEDLGVDALAGVRAMLLTPSAVGPCFQGTGQPPALWAPGFWLGGLVDEKLGKGWSVFMQLRANIGNSYKFELQCTPGGVYLPNFSLQGLAGVGWRFL